MKAVVLESVGEIRVKNVEVPECPQEGLLVKVGACAICATDVKVYRFGHRLIKPPRIIGHELSGTIVEVGKQIEGYKEGDRVTVAPAVPCGECYYCRRAIQAMCAELVAIGYHYDGGFAEYMVVPSRAIKNDCVNILPDNVSFEEGALTEPLASVLNGQEISGVGLGDTVVIIGAGPLGCLHARAARAHGAVKVIMTELSQERIELSKISGADLYINSSREDPVEKVLAETGGRGADVVIVACSSGKAQEQSLGMVRAQGKINFFGGLPKGKSVVSLDTNLIHYNQSTVSGTHGSAPRHNKLSLDLISKGTINVKPLITHRFRLGEFMEAITVAEEGKGLKVLIIPG